MRLIKSFVLSICISAFSLSNAATPPPGSLQRVPGSPFSTGSGPEQLSFSPIVAGNLFAAVVNENDDTVSVFQVNQATGFLTQIPTSPFATGAAPDWVQYSSVVSGNLFAAVINSNDDTVSVYAVNQSTGAFSEIPGSPFSTGSDPYNVAFAQGASGTLFAIVANYNGNSLSVYTVDPNSGTFTEVAGSPFNTGSEPFVAFSPLVMGNLFVATANFNDNTVSVFTMNQTTGALTEITGSPFPAGSEPACVTYSPVLSGNLYASVTNYNDDTISVYLVDQTSGDFTEIAGSPFAAGPGPNILVYSPVVSGYLFAAVDNFNDTTVAVYLVDQTTGALTPISSSPFTSGDTPSSVAYTPLLADGLFLGVPNNGDNNASVFSVFIPPPLPPVNLQGFPRADRFATQTDYVNTLVWEASTTGTLPAAYNIYRDQFPGNLIGTTTNLHFNDHNRKKGTTYIYFVVAVDQFGDISSPATVAVKSK